MKNEFTYPSKDGKTQIHAIEWIPEGAVRGVVQIVHGMVEFVDRYDRFARVLNEHGFYVTGNDHLGHGKSVTSEDQLGFFAERDGNFCMIGDIHHLREKAERTYPNVPYFMFGHSMGSFLVREYIEIHGEGLAGAIIMGTDWKTKQTLNAGIALTSMYQHTRGGHYRSKLINNMALGAYNKAFQPTRTSADWLSRDEKVVDAYVAEPLCQFMFTVNGYYNLLRGLRYAQEPKHMARVPKDLPVLIVSGARDAVGNFGKGPAKVAQSYTENGLQDVTLKLYPEDRHELLNELDKERVDQDILSWLEERL